MIKRCIVYLPYKLNEKGQGARMVRPRKMMQAFEDLGYSVSLIDGFSLERKQRIKSIKNQIVKGECYDFAYVESSTEPIFLTDPNHIPSHPFLDFGFFRFLNKHHIPIGLFYCDIYWKFKDYGEGMPYWKKKIALLCYALELRKYEKCISRFFLPDYEMLYYLGNRVLAAKSTELPPGCDQIDIKRNNDVKVFSNERPIKVFYVGGLGGHYMILELVKAVAVNFKTDLTICCREMEWLSEKSKFEPFLCDRIHIVHNRGDELERYYKEADICSLFFERSIYMDFAKPFKAYEYLAHEIPVIATAGTSIGDFVHQYDIGWCIPYDYNSISKTLEKIINNPASVEEKAKNCALAKRENLWTCRAKTVSEDLSSGSRNST